MNLNEFYNKIEITDLEKKKSLYYLKYRGLEEHLIILKFLEEKLKRRVRYSEIATTFRYDKRIRTIIYKYIGFIEEYLRATISNYYPNDIPSSIKIKDYEISRKKNNNTYEALADMLFSSLVKQFNRMNNRIKTNSFNSYNNELMEYIIDLRNAVSHNRFLLNYASYHNDSSLKENVNILYEVLPDFLKNRFVEEIADQALLKNKNKENQTDWDLPTCLIIKVKS